MLATVVVLLTATAGRTASWTSLGPPGGTVLSLAVHPSDGVTVYAGMYTGGVFKSTDGATSFVTTGTGPG